MTAVELERKLREKSAFYKGHDNIRSHVLSDIADELAKWRKEAFVSCGEYIFDSNGSAPENAAKAAAEVIVAYFRKRILGEDDAPTKA